MFSRTTHQPFLESSDTAANSGESKKIESNLQKTQEPRSLPAVLGTRDLTAFMLLIVLFIANNNGVQFGGPATFIYWILGLLTFLVPCAVVTQWLAKRYPGQGAPYLWATYILGARWGFISAFCAWLPGVLAVVSAIEGGLIFIQYLAPTWFATAAQQGLAVVLILIVPTGIACVPLRWLKHILFVVAALYFGVFILEGLAGGWWLLSGHPAALALNVPSTWKPTGGNFAVYGIIILALLGVDIPIFMGSEIRGGTSGGKRATSYVWWGTVLAFLAYVAGTFGIMVIVPPSQSGVITANVEVIQLVFGSLAGNIVDIVLAVSQFALTIAYILMFSRLLVVVAEHGRLPAPLTRVNRFGVPVLSIAVQAAAVALVTILSLIIVPVFFGKLIHPDELAEAIYSVLQAGTTVVWVCSIIQVFVLVVLLLYHRKSHNEAGIYTAETSERRRRLLIIISLIGTGASLIGIWATISSSWLPDIIPNGQWAMLVLGVTIISLAVGGLGSELPRLNALLSEQRRVNAHEMQLRSQLQESYTQQQVLLEEVGRLYKEQAQAAVTDPVTALSNHRAVMSRIDEEVSRCRRTQSSCAVLFVDLDHFKQINDTYGHQAGDAILREVGSRLRTAIRLEDFVGRYGGEEFAVVLTGADLSQAYQAAERLRLAVADHPYFWEMENALSVVPIEITASIGVAVYQLHGVTREELIEAADQAMYGAKRGGRNRVRIAEVELTKQQSILENSLDQGRSLSFGAEDLNSSSSLQEVLPNAQVSGYDPARELVAVQALTVAANAHDRGTGAHAQRMIRLAETTARILGRPEEELELIRLGALLHDIGKIGIPEAILHKPGPLTDEEWEIMRNHPLIGRQMLEQLGGIFQLLSRIIVAHHERWDGHGYPLGLAKEEIPMSARILAVVDSYDAMTSDRPYRAALSAAEARAELERCAGRQYDPQVVEAFLQGLDEEVDITGNSSQQTAVERV
jgi:diguanylate cyclase (GGDEF)-like protein/putative nucleotidyltransferase with HDIG domain